MRDDLREKIVKALYHYDYVDGTPGTTRDCEGAADAVMDVLRPTQDALDRVRALRRIDCETHAETWLDADAGPWLCPWCQRDEARAALEGDTR